jgi:fatty-acyl-CoA synthase
MLGAMQHWPLRVMRLIDHAEREHGGREIVSHYADGSTVAPTMPASRAMRAASPPRWSGSASARAIASRRSP